MKNWLTKIYNYAKPFLTNRQWINFYRAIQSKDEKVTWEEANVVSSLDSIPIKNEKSSPEKEDKETQIFFEAFKNLTPEYLLVIAEMRNLLNSELKKIVFHALATKLSINEVATHLGITPEEVSTIYQEAIKDIHIQSSFIRKNLDNEARKATISEFTMNKPKWAPRSEQAENAEENIERPSEKEKTSKIPFSKQKLLLSKPIHECLTIETRMVHAFYILNLNTLEDLLRFISVKGLEALKCQRCFGQVSLNKLTNELIRKGILKADGSCKLYKYITKPETEES